MSITQTALKERGLSLQDLVSPDLEPGYCAYVCAQAIGRLEQLKLDVPEAYQKFPEFETLLQRFQREERLTTPQLALQFLEEITSFRNAAARFLIDYYRNSTCERFGLNADEYFSLGVAARSVNKELHRLFAREYEDARKFELPELAAPIRSVLQLNALREEAVSRNRVHGLSVTVNIRRDSEVSTFDGAMIEDILCDEMNQAAPIRVVNMQGASIEVTADSATFSVRPFQGPFYEIAQIVSRASKQA